MADEKKDVLFTDAQEKRNSVHERYEASLKPPEEKNEEVKVEEKKEEPPKPDLKKEEPTTAPIVKDAPAPKEPIKTVPHEALHEEREKHKETKAKMQEIQKQLEVALEEAKKSKEPPKQDDSEFDLVTKADLKAKDQEIAELRKRIGEIEPVVKKRAEMDESEALKARKDEFEKNVSSAHDSLTSEGFPGFREFKTLVGEEITRLVSENESNKHLDSPAGWAKVYRETVYPKLAQVISDRKKLEKKQEKIDLKKEGNLSKSPGSMPESEGEESTEFTVRDYLEQRKKVSAVG